MLRRSGPQKRVGLVAALAIDVSPASGRRRMVTK